MKRRALVIVGNVGALHSALQVPLAWAVATAGLSVCNKTTYEANSNAVLVHFAKKKQVAYVLEQVLADSPELASVVATALEMEFLVVGTKPADKREAESVTVDSFLQARSVARQLLSIKRREGAVSMLVLLCKMGALLQPRRNPCGRSCGICSSLDLDCPSEGGTGWSASLLFGRGRPGTGHAVMKVDGCP